jgi:lysophospholipase L1-like esterase
MKLLDRRRLINVLLVASLGLNVATIAYLAHSGGLRRIFLKMDLVELPRDRAEFQKEMEARYRKIPTTPAEVVFAGDSLVADGPWAEFYTEVHNRGIGGDTVAGLLTRLDEITEGRPRKLFLLVGANDLSAAVPVEQFLRHYRTMLGRIREESPGTAVTVIGLLPVNRGFPRAPNFDSTRVAETNRRLAGLVAEFPGVRFLDLGRHLVDASGNLRREFTTDGLHMNIDGYLAIREALRGVVTGDEYRKAPEEAPKP